MQSKIKISIEIKALLLHCLIANSDQSFHYHKNFFYSGWVETSISISKVIFW